MFYTYEGSIERVEGDWVVHVGAFHGCFGCGKTIRKACAEAAEALRLFIAVGALLAVSRRFQPIRAPRHIR